LNFEKGTKKKRPFEEFGRKIEKKKKKKNGRF